MSIKSSFMEIVFFLCVFSRSDVSGKTSSVRSKLEEVMKYHTKQS